MPTPSLIPPIVQTGDARLLLEEAVIAAVLAGLRRARPELFEFGTYDVASPQPILAMAKAGGGVYRLNYKVAIPALSCDLPPDDVTVNGFANPFTLNAQQLAVYARLVLDVAGDPPTMWSERVVIDVWIKAELLPIQPGELSFRLMEVQVQVQGLTNLALNSILNHVAAGVLDDMILKLKFPLNGLMAGDLFELQLDSITLGLNAIDIAASIA